MMKQTTSNSGFTLVELMMASAISILVAMGIFSMYVLNQNAWSITTLTINSSSEASRAIGKIVYGYGTGESLRMAKDGDVTYTPSGSDWTVAYESGTRWIQYVDASNQIVNHNGDILAENVIATAAVIDGGLQLTVTVNATGGGKTANSTMTSFIRFRNELTT